MSGSDDPQILPDQKKEELVDPKSPQSETAAEEREKENVQDQTEIPELIKDDQATPSHREESSQDVDGFKTPTSSDHKIPPITHCPPAPMKLRPPPSKLKRKAASPPPSIHPDEVESIFSPIANDQDDHKIKKARTESSDDQ